jgi:hypothetical protein
LNDYVRPQLSTAADLTILASPLVASPFDEHEILNRSEETNNHLRSVKELCGYALWGPDGQLGKTADFVVADNGWTMPYMLIYVANDSAADRTIMIHTSCMKRISWERRRIDCTVSRKLLALCPYFPSDSKPSSDAPESNGERAALTPD